jgi:hypothetical protein
VRIARGESWRKALALIAVILIAFVFDGGKTSAWKGLAIVVAVAIGTGLAVDYWHRRRQRP